MQLIKEIDATTRQKPRVEALNRFFKSATDEDKLWCIALFTGKKPKRAVKTNLLKIWTAEIAQIPYWLFDDTYHVVGDLAETMALIVPFQTEGNKNDDKTLTFWINELDRIKQEAEENQKDFIIKSWRSMGQFERFVFNKLLTGGFRIGMSRKTMVKGISAYTNIPEAEVEVKISGNWTPGETSFENLLIAQKQEVDLSKPYPFYLAYALEDKPEDLGAPSEWSAEWKWDGIRAQLIVRQNELFIWSRGEELVTEKFPEFHEVNQSSKDVVVDGEILAWKDEQPLNFAKLQTRIGRKKVAKTHLKNAPVVLKAYDLLEYNGVDLRSEPLSKRRALLKKWIDQEQPCNIHLSNSVEFKSWETLKEKRQESRSLGTEGFMLKRKNAPYKVGRKKGDWWKWKVDPYTIDAVLIYAMRGHGRRANLYTDYTFAVWGKNDELVPFTKAYSGLKDEEFKQVDQFVKRNTIERFGPVRSVQPALVFELAFEGIAASSRHKSGIALRFPRMKRWRKDKPITEANTLEDLNNLLKSYEGVD